MRTMTVIPVDSVIGLLTNSSSEMFVSKQGMTIEAVKEAVRAIVAGYGVMQGVTYDAEEMIGEPRMLNTREEAETFFRENMCYIMGDDPYYQEENTQIWASWDRPVPGQREADRQKSMIQAQAAREKKFKELADKTVQKESRRIDRLVGCVLLPSARDNSIPYELWDILDTKLGGFHFHRG
jgi:hypothetical protein